MAKILGKDPKRKVDISQSKAVACEKCGDDLYIPAMRFRKISKIALGTAKDAIIPIEVYMCAECGTINTELLPDELKNLK